MNLSFFNDVPAVLSYVTSELVATLRDDADELERYRDLLPTMNKLRAKIDDIETVTPLIEAAPDLLAALEWFCEFCGEHEEWESEQFPPDTSEREWLDNARAAIAKAKGAT